MTRFWDKVTKLDTGCWEWTASCNGGGYGKFKFEGKKVYAHRFSYEISKGPIPKGLQIDHLCRNTKCVNPGHLEAVTSAENSRRAPTAVTSINRAKTHCCRGHEFTVENTRVSKAGKRTCIICYRIWDSNRYYTKRRRVL